MFFYFISKGDTVVPLFIPLPLFRFWLFNMLRVIEGYGPLVMGHGIMYT